MTIFDSADPDETSDFMRRTYTSMRMSARGEYGGLRAVREQLPGVALDHVTYRMSVAVDADPVGAVCVGRVLDGRVRWCDRDGERSYRPGGLFFAVRPEVDFHVEIESVETAALITGPALLAQVAQVPRDRGPVRMLGYEPVTPAAGRRWWRVYRAVASSITLSPEPATSPLVGAAAAQLLAAVTLESFPNTTLVDPMAVDRRDAHPDALRRAIAFIESHPDRPIAVGDIAAACVTVRAVQLAFRRHLGTSPMRYLSTVRMDHAHRDLISADPRHATVTEIATRWGFGNPSRFAASYRAAHGVPPSHTLRRRR